MIGDTSTPPTPPTPMVDRIGDRNHSVGATTSDQGALDPSMSGYL